MKIYKKEIIAGFDKLLYSVIKNENEIFTIVFENSTFVAKYVTNFESDNGYLYNEGDALYEEFNCINFEDINTKEQILVDYKTMPKSVFCNDVQIF